MTKSISDARDLQRDFLTVFLFGFGIGSWGILCDSLGRLVCKPRCEVQGGGAVKYGDKISPAVPRISSFPPPD